MQQLSSPFGTVTQLHSTNVTQPTNNTQALQPELKAVLDEMTHWRAYKKNPSERVPDELWEKIFALEKTIPGATIRRTLNLSSQQYHRKFSEFKSVTMPAIPSVTQVPEPLCQVTLKRNPYEQAPLPSAKTLVVEFCREDGKIMKIHSTQDSIPTLINTFFGA